ncbi:MAG: hypothetical protein SGJ15_12390 [Bacteroidota bacterium]|nr:hypothetical protein [Bacteroidota bacterium]
MQKPEVIHFPIYRKYKNNKRFYKIINSKEFEELQLIGSKSQINHIKATQFPEFTFINDLIQNYGDFSVAITEKEYLEQKGV